MNEKTIEWNLAFPRDEVVAGLEKMFVQHGYTFTRADAEVETRFVARPPSGALALVAQPVPIHRSPFNPLGILPRTLLNMTFTGVSEEDEKIFMRRLTLAFLRAGG